MSNNRIKRRILTFLLMGMTLAFAACGQHAQQDASSLSEQETSSQPRQETSSQPQPETESGWKRDGFAWETAISDNLLNVVDNSRIEFEQPDHVQGHLFWHKAYGNAFYILDVFYVERGTQYLLQRMDPEGNSEQTELKPEKWNIAGGQIIGIDVVDEAQLVFWVVGTFEENDEHQVETAYYYAVYTDLQGNLQKSVDIIDILKEEGIWKNQGYVRQDIYCDGSGNIYICDTDQNKIYLVDQQGALVMSCPYRAGEKQNAPQGFRTDAGELIFVCGEEKMPDLIWLDANTREGKRLSTPAI